MSDCTIDTLIKLRHFPPVVHARHARALLAEHDEADLRQWVGGYAITVPEHRKLIEEILGSLAWKPHGLALLAHGMYGVGKSHLLVLLHLLTALPLSWPTFIETHSIFGRYATAMQAHKRLVIHFSLEDYHPRAALEATIRQELHRQWQLPPSAFLHAGGTHCQDWMSGPPFLRHAMTRATMGCCYSSMNSVYFSRRKLPPNVKLMPDSCNSWLK